MTSTESKEPKGSASSSTDLFAPGAEEYYRKVLGLPPKEQLPVEQIHKWKRCTHCFHREHSARCTEAPVPGTWSWTGRCGCLELTPAQEIADKCKGAGGCPEHPTERQEALLEICACTHPRQKHRNLSEDTVICEGGGLPCGCNGFEPEDPPLTPEEEEGPPCSEVEGCDGQCCQRADAPPQPERRPPHVYSYSVQGHLYEVALSGDATVVAQDGALIITHSLGPVAGIVQARPLEGEQS